MDTSAKAKRKQRLQIAVGIVISLVFVFLALRNIEFSKLWATFAKLNAWWLIPGAIIILGTYYLRVLLWQLVLKQKYATNQWDLFRIITIGYFTNNILPLKLGEVVRAWLLSKKEQLPMSTAFAVVVMERGSDLLAMLIYFLVMLMLVPFAPWLKLSGAILGGVGMGFLLVVLLNYRFGGHLLEKIEGPLNKLHPKIGPFIHRQLDKFLEGLKLLNRPSQALGVMGLALLAWLGWMVVTYTCFKAMNVNLPFLAAVFLIVVLNFGLMIPSSPGGIGVFEFMVILALKPFGVEKELALGIGFTFHMLQYVLTLVLGWVFALQMNVSMSAAYHAGQASGESGRPVTDGTEGLGEQ